MPNQPPLPKRIAWFAPWTWKRRWWGLAVLLLVGYPLSIGPAYGLLVRGWFPLPVYAVVYEPIIWCARHSPRLSEVLRWYSFLFLPSN